jgi:hypothetical protein
MEIREGAAGIRNFIVMGFKENGIDYSSTATLQQAALGTLSLGNGIVFGNGLLAGTADSTRTPDRFSHVHSLLVGGTNDPGLINP